MKKIIKRIGFTALVLAAGFGLFLGSNAIVFHFENSGTPGWIADDSKLEEEFVNCFTIRFRSNRIQGFKNSGLPENIEIDRLFR